MLKNKNIICISSIDWDFVWQGHQEVMSELAKKGNKVLFIENTGVRTPNIKDFHRLKKRVINWFKSTKGFRKEMENLYIYSPVILPFPYSGIARWINRRMLIRPLNNWMKIMEFHDTIVWTFLPTGTALDIIKNIEKKLLIYYCIADFYELVNEPKKVKKTEDELIKISDLIFVQGKVLYDKCKHLNDNVYIFPFGVKIETFDKFSCNTNKIPEDIKDIKKPIIGYVGGIHKHIDFSLLKFIAENRPNWSIVLVGPVQTDILEISKLKNIFLLGKKNFILLPDYINEFDVCIIPYRKSHYTATVYPTKLNEYHAMGKPVVSTDLPEVIEFNFQNNNLIFIGKTYKEFIEYISELICKKRDDTSDLRIISARKNSWSVRIEKMSNLLERTLESKANSEIKWQKVFLRLYKTCRIRTSTLIVTFISMYILLFYTPFVWFMANPLKVSQIPQKADAIVVFAGGAGESGMPGQGYEERVECAVELYKRKYAQYMIFSSGYTYVYKEPLVMKALAVSLGIPESAIILEDKAKNTYENVNFTKEILEDKGWDKILLVSSPYHMLRVSSVFNKIARNIKVNYVPITSSLFYSHPDKDMYGRKILKRVNLQQIKAIVHEYLGILYYWLKGWI